MDDKNLNQIASQDTEIPDEIAGFLKGIMMDAKIYTDDQEMNDRVMSEIYLRFTTYVNSRVLDYVPEDKMEDLENLLKNMNDAHEIDDFIAKNVPNYQAVYNTILLEFRDIYLGKMDMADLPDAIKVKV